MDTTHSQRTSASRSSAEMSAYEFAALGVTRVIYVRPANTVALDGGVGSRSGYAVFAGDGTFLQTVPSMAEITTVADEHELEIATLH